MEITLMLTRDIGMRRESEKMQEYKVSWEEVIKLCDRLALRLELGEYKKIIAVSRGGLIPACLLAHRLKINRVECINLNKLDPGGDTDLIRYQWSKDEDKIIVVDDIVDSGTTLTIIKRGLPYARYVVLYDKTLGYFAPDLSGQELTKDIWVVFPWEVN